MGRQENSQWGHQSGSVGTSGRVSGETRAGQCWTRERVPSMLKYCTFKIKMSIFTLIIIGKLFTKDQISKRVIYMVFRLSANPDNKSQPSAKAHEVVQR